MKKEVRRFSELYALLSVTMCIYGVFIMPYLKTKGFSVTELGFFNSISIGAGIFGQFLMGYMCDLIKTIKKVFIVALLILIALAIMFEISSNIIVVIIGVAAFGFFQAPLYVLIDSWILVNKKEISRNFGSIKAWASIGWATCSVIMGGIIAKFGFEVMFIFYIIFALIVLFLIRNVEDVRREKEAKKERVNPFILFKNYKYIFIVIIMLLLSLSIQPLSFIYLKIDKLGGNSQYIGIVSFVMAMSELPVFFSSKAILKKFKLSNLLIFSSFAFAIRMVLLSLANSCFQIIVLGTLQVFSNAVFILASKYFVNEVAPKELQISAQSTASAICAIGGIIFSTVAGYLIDKNGVDIVFNMGAVTSSICLLLMIIIKLFTRKKGEQTY